MRGTYYFDKLETINYYLFLGGINDFQSVRFCIHIVLIFNNFIKSPQLAGCVGCAFYSNPTG